MRNEKFFISIDSVSPVMHTALRNDVFYGSFFLSIVFLCMSGAFDWRKFIFFFLFDKMWNRFYVICRCGWSPHVSQFIGTGTCER